MPRSDKLSDAVASHPDMLIFYHNGNIITSANYCERFPYVFSDIRELSNAAITFTEDTQEPKYPKDAIFNALCADEYIFLKEDTVSQAVKDFAKKEGLKTVNVNQGYPACCALTFGNNAITADRGLADAMTRHGVKVTLISEGGISLPPHKYGFIGGASGVVGRKVYFFGDIMNHPDGQLICNAIKEAGYTPISLSDEPLRDFGGIISLQG